MSGDAAPWTLLGADFDEQLRALVDHARSSLGVDLLAVAELAAPDGALSAHWRASSPGASNLPPLTLEELADFPKRSEPAVKLDTDCPLGTRLSGRTARVIPLDVTPMLHAHLDAFLLVVGDIDPSPASLAEFVQTLVRGMTFDRKRRLADLLLCAVDQAADPIEVTDQKARIVFANRAWEQTYGHRAEQALGQTVGHLFRDPEHPVHDRAFYQFTLARLAKGQPWLGVIASRSQAGKRIYAEVQVSPFTTKDSLFQGNFAIRRKLDHREERDKALTVAHQEFRSVLSVIPDGVVVLRDREIYYANRAFLHMVDLEENRVIGRNYLEFVHPGDRKRFRREHQRRMTRVRMLRGGTARFAEISTAGAVSFEGRPATILISRDTTDYHIAQERLARTEKLSALGSLAAGVAHEINNPLAYVSLNIQQLRETAKDKLASAELEVLDDAIEGADRMRDIVAELKGFSGSDGPGPAEPVNVVQAVTSALNIAQNEIRHRALLKREHEAGVFVLAREGQLVQVLVNVLVNAAQAIPTSGERQHVIQVTSRRSGESRVQITVSDTGEGIAEHVLAHVFDPFATGKRRGEGSGLGLTISKRIIEEFAGTIEIASTRGEGTDVTIELPYAEAPRVTIPAPEPVDPSRQLLHARVLVIDDELAIAKSLRRVLERHEVVIARDGIRALELLENDTDFDCVLCDLMMPGLPGSELYERLTKLNPEMGERFIFMTGGAFTQDGRAFLEGVNCPVLQKPFDPSLVIEYVDRAARRTTRTG